MGLLIRGGRAMDPASGLDKVMDVLIQDGKVAAMGGELAVPEGCEVLDAAGLVVAPGLVDTHVHFRDPGFTHKEDLASGARAAARGGVTTVVCMANTRPVPDNAAVLEDIRRRAAALPVRVLQAASATVGQRGAQACDFAALRAAGAACFSDDGLPIADASVALEAMRRAAASDVVLSLHEEDPALLRGAGVNAGPVADKLGVPGAAAVAEDALVARDCMLALETGARVVIQHISSARAVDMVRWVKARGAKVEAEATPHHFTLTQEAVEAHGPLAKMNPPVRTEQDRQAIIEGLRDGTIGIIATDHAPHTEEEKRAPLTEAPSGIIGLETSLALGITELVGPGHLDLMGLLHRMSTGPAAYYRMDAGRVAVGAPGDLVVFDPGRRWTVEGFASKSRNSPFVGRELTGRVVYTICRGAVVYRLEDAGQ